MAGIVAASYYLDQFSINDWLTPVMLGFSDYAVKLALAPSMLVPSRPMMLLTKLQRI